MRILVLANSSDADAGFVGEALQARGATLVTHLREATEPPPEPTDFDAIVSLGSEWSVYWEHVGVEVAREAALLRNAVAADVPVLGLCFGGQILSHAMGGSVEPAPEPEIGWYEIESDVPHLIPHGPYVQWHSDRFVVPPGARELARSPVGPQAYTVGSAVGLQFHPEASPEVVRRWVVGGVAELTAAGGTPESFITESDARLAESRERAIRIVDAFLDGNLRS